MWIYESEQEPSLNDSNNLQRVPRRLIEMVMRLEDMCTYNFTES